MNVNIAIFQAGLVPGFDLSAPLVPESVLSTHLPPPSSYQKAIEGKHLLLPFLMLGLGYGIAVLVFMAGSVRALCK